MWGVAHGWNTDQFDRSVVIGPKYSQLAGGNGDGDGRGVVGTLLGPEKTTAPLLGVWVLFSGRRLGRPSNASGASVMGLVGVVVVGVCGCVLSVA